MPGIWVQPYPEGIYSLLVGIWPQAGDSSVWGGELGTEGGEGDTGGWFLKSFEVAQDLGSVVQGRH